MNIIEKIQEKVAFSSYKEGQFVTLNSKDIKSYFDFMVNQDKTMDIMDYNLTIINIDDVSDMITYDNSTRTFTFNYNEFYNQYLKTNNLDSIKDAYHFNFYLLLVINNIIAKVDLYRMATNKVFSNLEPLFYTNVMEEMIQNENQGILVNNYLKFKSMYLLDYFIRNTSKKFKFADNKDTRHMASFNKQIIEYYKKIEDDTPIFESIDYKLNSHSKSMIMDIAIVNRFGQEAYENYYNAKNNKKYTEGTTILNSLLLGKSINKEQNSNLIDISNEMSLFEYIEGQNNVFKEKIANRLK